MSAFVTWPGNRGISKAKCDSRGKKGKKLPGGGIRGKADPDCLPLGLPPDTYTLGTQSLTVLSLEAEAIRCPEGENFTESTASWEKP